MPNFLSNYAKLSGNRDISYRVYQKRLYVPKKYMGKRIIVKSDGSIAISKNGVPVNAQGFASIAKLSDSDIAKLAKIVNG